ncbi:MAG: ABC-F family ATP-binding cassette domain-containing protein [Deltaproteobacteria bacterium]|nr:ABC-F family ATP-binding cassette domain-containing protein [Deltaproteobacteria bacterium]
MSLINVVNLTLTFGRKEIFSSIGFQVEEGDHMGLVGPNGSGKTSLLRLLAQEISPDSGEVRLKRGARIGYLPQDISERLTGPLLPAVLQSIPGRQSLKEEINHIEGALKESLPQQKQEAMAARLTELHHDMNAMDIQFPAHKAEKILEGLGFRSDDFTRQVESLSGGWRMRAALGSILYQNPDLLLLDEPTNYLDIPSVRWLETFLRELRGALILVCHDRDFLNRHIERLISFEPEGMRHYKGNYNQYLKAREEDVKTQEGKARNQEQKIKEAKKFIDRFRAKATKARQAQSKIKLLKKIELVETQRKEKSIRFSFPEVPRSGRVVIALEGLSKAYTNNTLYQNINLTVMRGEKVAVIGPNGFGKTTLLRMVAHEIPPDQGKITLGYNVSLAYYAQHHSEMLNPNNSIIEEVYQVVPHESIGFVRSICGAFLFSGDDVDKPLKVLSGGEKARVCLAKMLIKPGNLILMDEPTNHLDLISSEILINALEKYNGTLLFVSHNQSFINRLATKIWDIRDKGIVEYHGTLYEYYDHLTRLDSPPLHTPPQTNDVKIPTDAATQKIKDNKKALRKEKAQQRTLVQSSLKPVKDRLSRLEDRIAYLENREKKISEILSDPDIFKDNTKSVPLLSEYREIRQELEESMREWEEKQHEMEKIQDELRDQDIG